VKQDKMGGECGTLGGEEKDIGSWVENLKEGNCMDDLGVDGRIIFKLIFKKTGWGDVDWIHLAQDMDKG
jgi:hypothetical protein